MSDTVAASPAIIAEKKPKKAAVSGSKKPKSTPTHPPTQQMVDAAIKTLKERGGSSLLAIKKYIAATYKVDVQKLAPFIKKYLKGAVISGKLVQTKGKGAAGSFKLSALANKEPKAKSAADKKKSAAKPKAAAAGDKLKKVSGEKKVKKAAAGTTKKSADKKKVEKPKVKSVKKTSAVKAKPTKAKAAAPKPKVPKAKSATASAAKPKKAVAAKKAKK